MAPAEPGADSDSLLGGAFETLFDPCSGDDVIAIAEAELRSQRALFVPEAVEALAQTFELLGRCWVVTLGKDPPQLRPPLAGLLDFSVNLGHCHVSKNDPQARLIPVGR
jgi:hypothetical protein